MSAWLRKSSKKSLSSFMKNKNETCNMHLSWQDKVLRVASRTSNLAFKQVEEVMHDFPGITYTMIPINSFGDKHKHISLIGNPVQDFFTRELDEALVNDEADIAVHSAKDLPCPI